MWWRVKRRAAEPGPFSVESVPARLATSNYETARWSSDKTVLTTLVSAPTLVEAATLADPAADRDECARFFAGAVAHLGPGWSLEWYDDGHEGFCWEADGVIRVGPDQGTLEAKRLILHEVAHAGTCVGEPDRHGLGFWREYARLLRELLPGAGFSASDVAILAARWNGGSV